MRKKKVFSIVFFSFFCLDCTRIECRETRKHPTPVFSGICLNWERSYTVLAQGQQACELLIARCRDFSKWPHLINPTTPQVI